MSTDERIRALLLRLGETNATPEAVCQDCPELLDDVRARWNRLRAFGAGLDSLLPAHRRADEDAAKFPGYAIEAVLGAGGMGTVYRARDLSSGRLVALKVVHPHLRALPGYVERLRREADIGSRVAHANVVRTLGLADHAAGSDALQALVTEYVEGQTLMGLLAELGRVPEQLCRHIGHEIAKGLAAIHGVGAVHRDLKPENVLITRHHVVKVMDLGIARALDLVDRLSLSGAFVGSLRYAAPEQLRGSGSVDARADLFALGLVLYELVTGHHALEPDRPSGTGTRARGSARRAVEVAPDVSPFFDELLARLLEDDRDARIGPAADVATLLAEGERSAWWLAREDAFRRSSHPSVARETRMHGRREELTHLLDVCGQAADGRGRVVLIEGEAGIGKSRLLSDWMQTLGDHGPHLLFGACAPGGAATATSAFASAFRSHFGSERLVDDLRQRLARSPALVPAFAALLRGEPPPDGTEALTQDAMQTAFVRTLQALAAERLTVLVIDDLHFAPPEGRALFSALACAVQAHRVVLVGTARPTLDSGWKADLARLPHVSRRTIRRLDVRDVAALLEEALGHRQAAEDLASKTLEKTDGNPYFVLEVLRELRSGGLLRRVGERRWELVRTIADIPCPQNVRELLLARLQALGPEDRETLQSAACCGPSFDPLLVAEAIGADRLAFLRRLASLETVHRLVRSAGRRFVFDHHLLHDVVYAGTPEPLRESLHAAVGAVLEARASAAPPGTASHERALFPMLVDHLLRGGQGARALRHLDAAVEDLERRYEYDAAMDLLRRTLAVPGLVAGERRCGLLLRLADRLERLARYTDEGPTLAEARSLADSLGDETLRARVHTVFGRYFTGTSKPDDAIRELESAIGLFRSLGDRRGEADATEALGSQLTRLGRYDEARARLEHCRDVAREAGARRAEASAHRLLGTLAYIRGDLDGAAEEQERAVALSHSVGDGPMERKAAGYLGILHWSQGRFDAAVDCYETLRSACRDAGDRVGEASALLTLSDLLCDLGRFAEALELNRRALDLTRETGSRVSEAHATATYGNKFLSLGKPTEASEFFRRGLDLARQ